MSRPRIKDWAHKFDTSTDEGQLLISSSEMQDLLQAWEDDLDDKDESLETTTGELEDARIEAKAPPVWGNCRRGCPESYLDKDGFCSPACAMGAPKGKYVTVVPESPSPSDIDGLWRI